MIMRVPYIRDPQAPTREEIHGPSSVRIADAEIDLSPWLTEETPDVGEPPSGWCPKDCDCGQPCAEFAGHQPPCMCFDG